MAENKGVLPSSNVNTLGNANNKWENVYANKFTGALTGNAATATALQTARTINGTSFNGSANITTSNWGTARNISIADATATNTGTGVSVNGSGNVTLKLPATIKASLTGNVTGNVSGSSSSCTGNSATATKATQDSAGQQINTTYIKGLSASNATLTYTKGDGSTGTVTVNNVATAINADKLDGYHYSDIVNNVKTSVMGAPNWARKITVSGHNTPIGFTAPANGFFLWGGNNTIYINDVSHSFGFFLIPVKKGDNFRTQGSDAANKATIYFIPCS